MDLKLIPEKRGIELTVRLSGDLNALTAPELSALLDEALDGIRSLAMDFAECDYVSSAGLRVLLATLKKLKAAKGDMRLINVGENFREVLQNTALDAVFDV